MSAGEPGLNAADPAVEIRELHTFEEMLAVPRVQQAVWNFSDGTSFYPPSLLAFADNGGVVLGGYDTATGEMVGFTFGFLARHWDGQLKLYSQATGVLPAYRKTGLAYRLKCAQRDWALAQGLQLITWTYDPLEMPNARLNVGKLGGLARRYRRNVYGEQFGQLNAGLPTDRFVVEWQLASPRVVARLAGRYTPPDPDDPALEPVTRVAGAGLARRLVDYNKESNAPALRVDLVADLQAVKAHDLELASVWRFSLRELFETYFSRGYAVTDFVTRTLDGARQNWYILRKEEA